MNLRPILLAIVTSLIAGCVAPMEPAQPPETVNGEAGAGERVITAQIQLENSTRVHVELMQHAGDTNLYLFRETEGAYFMRGDNFENDGKISLGAGTIDTVLDPRIRSLGAFCDEEQQACRWTLTITLGGR